MKSPGRDEQEKKLDAMPAPSLHPASIVYRRVLPTPFDEVDRRLRDESAPWLPAPESEWSQYVLSARRFGRDVGMRPRVEAGIVNRTPSHARMWIRWEDRFRPRRFPRFDGRIDVTALPKGRTRFSLRADYVPPAGTVGRVVDRTLMAGVAQALLDQLGGGIADRLAEPAPA